MNSIRKCSKTIDGCRYLRIAKKKLNCTFKIGKLYGM